MCDSVSPWQMLTFAREAPSLAQPSWLSPMELLGQLSCVTEDPICRRFRQASILISYTNPNRRIWLRMASC